jgi:hypothetical protein
MQASDPPHLIRPLLDLFSGGGESQFVRRMNGQLVLDDILYQVIVATRKFEELDKVIGREHFIVNSHKISH